MVAVIPTEPFHLLRQGTGSSGQINEVMDGTPVPRTDNCINIALVIRVGCHHAHVIHALVHTVGKPQF